MASKARYLYSIPVRYRFKRNRVIVGAIDEQWEADLVIMDLLAKYNNNYKYILTMIDVFSKYAWVIIIIIIYFTQ